MCHTAAEENTGRLKGACTKDYAISTQFLSPDEHDAHNPIAVKHEPVNLGIGSND